MCLYCQQLPAAAAAATVAYCCSSCISFNFLWLLLNQHRVSFCWCVHAASNYWKFQYCHTNRERQKRHDEVELSKWPRSILWTIQIWTRTQTHHFKMIRKIRGPLFVSCSCVEKNQAQFRQLYGRHAMLCMCVRVCVLKQQRQHTDENDLLIYYFMCMSVCFRSFFFFVENVFRYIIPSLPLMGTKTKSWRAQEQAQNACENETKRIEMMMMKERHEDAESERASERNVLMLNK